MDPLPTPDPRLSLPRLAAPSTGLLAFAAMLLRGLWVGNSTETILGRAIGGLFAAGEVVGGLHGAAYVTGSALGKAAIFGRIATRTALARGGSARTAA